MLQKITCIIVDDNEVDRLTLAAFLEDYPFIEVKGLFESPLEALSRAKIIHPDVLFLDIDMPEMNGLQLREQLMDIPACIFISSFRDFALESFELSAMDYLIKPFSSERLSKTISRLKEYMNIRRESASFSHTLQETIIFIKDGHNQVKLELKEIIYLEALNNYTGIVTEKKKYMVLSSLGTLLGEVNFRNFIRIHRSYAVQKQFIKKITAGEVFVHQAILPVGRTFKEALHSISRQGL